MGTKAKPTRNMIAVLAVLALGGTAVAQAPEKPADAPKQVQEAPKLVQVEKIALGTGVESRELVGEATEFDVSAGRIYCWTKIVSQNVPTTIKHVWYTDEQQPAEVPLNIKYPVTRTWSNKAIWAGKWRVEVVSETGDVLASADFTVKAQPAPAAPAAP
ncbi:MAG: hypothetical protein AUI21_10385 [Nitrospirae bacterium 13_1_40CM_2_62_10]|nr:MAG: hypothetical protein AUI96_02855 [Nitrospirae bacterium 13_1_40CM_3_62_11]OLD36613.1 MAG: hypothetical protein AUI21_10385 [Nitrospirae bacterium 13_1_40CM_2_62_10]